jgi:hypothetical protein
MPKPKPSRAAVLAALALLSAGAAQAQSSPWYLGLSQSFSSQSNLLRLAEGATAPEGFSKSDSVSSTALVAGLDQLLGRQRLNASLTLRSDKYGRNSIYDNQGWTLGTGLEWQTVERFSGSVNLASSRQLSSFGLSQIGSLTRRNLETSTSLDTVTRLGVAGPWAVELGLGTLRVDNSLDDDTVRSRNYEQDNASLGLRWRPSALLSMTLSLRGTEGRYPEFQRQGDGSFQSDRFRREDVSVAASWLASGASTLDLRLSNGRTRYDLASDRNFSGLTGSLGWRWSVSSKLTLSTRLSRDTGQDSYAVTVFDPRLGFVPGTADYSRTQTALRLRADWAPTAKLSFNASATYAERDIVRTLPPTAFGQNQATGTERADSLSLGGRWFAMRSLVLGCDFSQDKRRGAGQLGSNYKAESASCFGQFTLQ